MRHSKQGRPGIETVTFQFKFGEFTPGITIGFVNVNGITPASHTYRSSESSNSGSNDGDFQGVFFEEVTKLGAEGFYLED